MTEPTPAPAPEPTPAPPPAPVAAAPSPAPAAEPTLLGGEPGAPEPQVQAPADWPTDWREKLAGDDKKALEQLKRSGSPLDVWKKARSLEQKLSSGEYKRDLAKDATPEQVAEWRKERGVPEAADGYKIELPGGVIPGEADKPVIDAFTKAVHEKNWDNAKVNEALSWYYGEQERQQAERAAADREYHIKSQVELRAEFGPEFTPNINAVKNLLEGMPEDAKDNFLAGRMADGSRIGDNPEMLKWLAGLSRELNPAATLIPAGSGDQGKGLNDRIADIEKLMGDRSSDYWRGPKAEPMQAELRNLYDARDRTKNKAQAA